MIRLRDRVRRKDHVLGRNVVPHTEEHRGAQLAVRGALAVLHLDHHLGPDPVGRLQGVRHLGEGRDLGDQRIEPLAQEAEIGVFEPAPRLADVHERPRPRIVLAQDERAKRALPVPLAPRDPADDRLEGPADLDLHPVGAPGPRPVRAGGLFRDNPLEPLLAGRLEQREPLALKCVAAKHPCGKRELLQPAPALRERARPQIAAAPVQAVKHRVDHGNPLGGLPHLRRLLQVKPLLHPGKTRLPALVGGDDLTVEHRPVSIEMCERFHDLGELRVDPVERAAVERDLL